MKYFIIILFQVCFSLTLYSQTKDCTKCWKVTDEKSSLYFNNLFANITGNDPNLTLIKLDFVESKMVYVTGIQVLRRYCKGKYKLADSLVKKFTKQFIRNGTKIPLADTILFKELDNEFSKYSFFADSTLDKYRVLGVKNFMIKYCDGGIIRDKGVPVSIIAYLFENRIFWNNADGRISPSALHQIEESCKIKWDDKKRKWIDKSNF
jgi:hypothetical protein